MSGVQTGNFRVDKKDATIRTTLDDVQKEVKK